MSRHMTLLPRPSNYIPFPIPASHCTLLHASSYPALTWEKLRRGCNRIVSSCTHNFGCSCNALIARVPSLKHCALHGAHSDHASLSCAPDAPQRRMRGLIIRKIATFRSMVASSIDIFNSSVVALVTGVPSWERGNQYRAAARRRARTREQLFSPSFRREIFLALAWLFGLSGRMTPAPILRSALVARNVTPIFSSRASASRTRAQRSLSTPRSSVEFPEARRA